MGRIILAFLTAACAILMAAAPCLGDEISEAMEGNATLYTVCDNECEIAINGTKVISISREAELGVKEVTISKGDLITAKCSDYGREFGFACVIAFKDKTIKPIVSDKRTWKAYIPKDKQDWSDIKGLKSRASASPGTNLSWKSKITQRTDVECESIWGEVTKGKASPVCYLMYEVK